jgi:transcriptional regulator with XRE-family HTH domain
VVVENEMMAKKNNGTETLPFGRALRALMQERHLTLKQVAELAGVSTSVVQNWLEGKAPHDLKAVARLAQALGIGFKALLVGEPENIGSGSALSDLFQEQDLFDGLCKLSIKRLVPRKDS